MNKTQLVAYVAKDLKTSRLQAGRLVESVLKGIQTGLQEEKSVTLTGFGTFEVKPRKARVGRNPHTGARIPIPPGQRVGFRVGKSLRESI